MSKTIFIRCSNKDCKNRPYPVDAGNEKKLKLCPECDPKAHKAIKFVKQQAKMVSNKPVRQSLDVGKVQSLQDGAQHVKLEDKPGVEVDVVHADLEVPNSAPKIPVITKAEAQKQMSKGKRGKGKK